MANWSDLGPRVGSAVVMTLVGAVAVWLGGVWFTILVGLAVWGMTWEIFRMCKIHDGKNQVVLAFVNGLIVTLAFTVPQYAPLLVLAVVAVWVFAYFTKRFGGEKSGYLFVPAVFCVGYGLITMRMEAGILFILWLLLVVIASDVMGYFAGKTFGGPKFWPSISPKKTWSGTVAGWVGAALVGLGFVIWNDSPVNLIFISVLISFAGQMGDIAESALKRKTDIKDSSNLIPGHGGVLDRFDAVSGAVIFLLVLSLIMQVSV